MIEFECNSCNRGIKVEDDKAGKRGKCPRCKSIIVVPEKSTEELIFDEEELSFKNESFQKLYKELLNRIPDKIENHHIQSPNEDEEVLLLTLKTGLDDIRTQKVGITLMKENSRDHFILLSTIGEIDPDLDNLVDVLRVGERVCFCNIGLNEENLLSIKYMVPVDSIDYKLFIDRLIVLAEAADVLEDELFGLDVN